jgi:predicted esterase
MACLKVSKLALVFWLLLSTMPVHAACYQGSGSRPDTSYVVYIPDKLDKRVRHPWILGFSPVGQGMGVVDVMQQACDENGWICVASNNSHNGLNFKDIDAPVLDTIYSAIRTLPVDPARMYAGGLSGGSMVTHWLAAKHPDLVRGIVINCGMMNRTLRQELGYPAGKDAVFMTNPNDIRYHEIRDDFQYVTSHGWRTSWLEFPGGHEWAPPEYYSSAFKWLNQQAKLHKPAVVAAKPPEPSLSDLQAQLAAVQKGPNVDGTKVANLQEQIADALAKTGKNADAETNYKEALAIKEKSAPDAESTATLMKKLAEASSAQGKNEGADELLKRAIAILERQSNKKALSETLQVYAKTLYKTGKTSEADALYARVKELNKN